MKHWKSILLLGALTLLISGCQKGPTLPEKPVIDPSLPKLTNLKTLTDMSEVGFEWVPSYDERVQGYYLYRSNPTKTTVN